ncbi:MAG: SPOR domain-containing protein [Gammaproteobacteria bacterium]|jgi:cell division protein FtsN
MPRDYKPRTTRRRRRDRVSPWFGLVAGLLIGLSIAFLIYIKLIAPPAQPPGSGTPDSAPGASRQAPEQQAETRKDSVPPPPKPRFDFYTILPEMEVVIPEQEIQGKPEEGVRKVEKPGTYFLQAASFRSAQQAEKFKAELALLGLEASIQKVTINNRDTYHRVRVGPFRDLDALNRARRVLSKQGIESTLVRIRN